MIIILSQLNMDVIFTKLIIHANDQFFETCHRIHLIKSIILKYVRIWYFYMEKQINSTISETHFYNKLILLQ